MSNAFFTADLHLGHRLVSDLRGFDTVEEHDRAVMGNLMAAVGVGDTLWVLGDLSAGGSAGQRNALDLLASFSAEHRIQMHLIAGNHDSVHPLHRNAHKWDQPYRHVFDSVQPFARRRIAGRNVWLSHFPWKGGGDHTARDRYETVRLNDDGTSWLLHGHTHSLEAVDLERRQLHVGLDAWDLSPVPLDQIAALIGGADEPAGESA